MLLCLKWPDFDLRGVGAGSYLGTVFVFSMLVSNVACLLDRALNEAGLSTSSTLELASSSSNEIFITIPEEGALALYPVT